MKKEKNVKKYFLGGRNKIWYILNILLTCIYLIWRLFFTLPIGYGVVSMVAGISLFVVELLGMFEALVHYCNMSDLQEKILPVIEEEEYPDVDIYIATYNEPTDLLFKTINGCKYLHYPDKSKVHIYLCDDGDRAEMRKLAEEMQIHYLRRDDHAHAKAGNLNNALKMSNSPYIVTLDADMIPHKNLLMHTIPYFIDMEKQNVGKEEEDQKHIGFVQTPQAFYNPDLFQYNLYSEGRIPNEQDYFYRDIQVSRNKSNSVIYGGSNTVLARRALEEIGGFYTETITEDYATGILMQKKGYICYATDEVLASGLSPTDLKSLINQRIRWARGVIQTNRKMHIYFSKDLSFSQKINYWASSWYWYAPLKRLIYFLGPILYATFGYTIFRCTLWEVLIFWLPMYISSNIALRMLSKNIRTTKWTSIYETVLFPFLLIPVLLETFGISMKQFKVTKKDGAADDPGQNIVYLLPFILLVLLSVIGIINCLRTIFESNNMGPVVVLFWLFTNLFTLLMSMFFIMGRKPLRKSERAMIVVDCVLKTGDAAYPCKTLNVSEQGLAILMEYPINIDDRAEVDVTLTEGHYTADIKAQVVHVAQMNEKWKYAFRVTDYKDSYTEYLQLVYDRVPTLPQNLDNTSGGFDDLSLNIRKRIAKPFYENRKMPRIFAKTLLEDTEKRKWRMLDFNYRYCSFALQVDMPEQMEFLIDEEEQVYLICKKMQNGFKNKVLYQVVNYDALYSDMRKKLCLESWVCNYLCAGEEAEPVQLSAPTEEVKPQEFHEMDCI